MKNVIEGAGLSLRKGNIILAGHDEDGFYHDVLNPKKVNNGFHS